MPPLSPESFESPTARPEPSPQSDRIRALVASARSAERSLESLRHRASVVGVDIFAQRIAVSMKAIVDATNELARSPR